MAAGITYTPIASTTLNTTASSVTFSSISGSYTDLVAVVVGINSGTGYGEVWARVGNGSVDSGSNYSRTVLRGNGSSGSSFRTTNETYIYMDNAFAGSGNGNLIMNFQNYSNTTTNKTILIRSNGAGNHVNAQVELWRSTSAIDIITFYPDSGSFQSGSVFSLYGITAA